MHTQLEHYNNYNIYNAGRYPTGLRVSRRSFGSKSVIVNGYTLPSSSLARNSSSPPNSEMCTKPATPSSIEASAPCLLYLMTTASTLSSFLYLLPAETHGSSESALIESDTLPSFISITFTLIFSPTL